MVTVSSMITTIFTWLSPRQEAGFGANAGRLLFRGNEREHTIKNSKFFGMQSFVALVFTALFCFGLVACTGGEGGEGGMFASDGESRGMLEFPVLGVDESFAGLLEGMEIAIYYDSGSEMFKGRLRNEAAVPVCDISVSISADGSPVGQSYLLDGLTNASGESGGGEGSEGGESGSGEGEGEHGGGGEGDGGNGSAQDRSRSGPFSVPVSAGFSQWQVTVDSHGCSSAPGGSGGGEGGGEGAGEHGGSGEGGSEGGGGESGDEASPPTPITDPSMGTNMKNGQTYDFSFNESRGVFEGTVENPTSAVICGSKTEIHGCPGFDMMSMVCNAGVIELGPTIPEDLQPGDMINIVMYTDRAFDTYSLHPESSSCP